MSRIGVVRGSGEGSGERRARWEKEAISMI